MWLYRILQRVYASSSHVKIDANLSAVHFRHPSEFIYRDDGSLAENPYRDSRARLENEYKVIQFLKAAAPRIPVPDATLFERDGLLILRTSRAPGTELAYIDDSQIDQVVTQVTEEMRRDIIPTLQAFTSTELGGLNTQNDGLAASPRLWDWERLCRRITRPSPDLVFCHGDMSQGNVFVDPNTFKITCIIDWEYGGYFPPEYEPETWKYRLPIMREHLELEKLWQKMVDIGAVPQSSEPTIPQQNATEPPADSGFLEQALNVLYGWVNLLDRYRGYLPLR